MITDIPKCTRICADTGAEIPPGGIAYSVLFERDGTFRRTDYSPEAWKTCPYSRKKKPKNPKERNIASAAEDDDVFAWWKYRVPMPSEKKAKLAPNEILLKCFEQLSDQLDKLEMRYVLALLLIRRRLFRLEREERGEDGLQRLFVYCPKHDGSYEVLVAPPEDGKIEDVQNELAALFSG